MAYRGWQQATLDFIASIDGLRKRRSTLRSLFALITGFATIVCAGCSSGVASNDQTPPNLMIRYGCPTCHVIPRVPGATGKVGPSLEDLAQRSYIAGTLPNSPDNLELWIQHPQRIHPGTAMPEMAVTPDDAKRIASFLQARP